MPANGWVNKGEALRGEMTLSHYTSADLIVPQLLARTGSAVVGELCAVLERHDRVSDCLGLYNQVIAHENLSPTILMTGCALPHARLQGASQLSFALGRSRERLDWFGAKSAEVRLVFLFAVPESEAGLYLKVLSLLAKLGQDRKRMQKLLEAPDGETMFEILRGSNFTKSVTKHEYSVSSTTH
jgi:mannitol/fructose-specific phosphotransferase system IIA component (Ntr-type)